MGNFFIAVGGTGQMVAIAYWKLQQLIPWCKPAEMYYMDRDPITDLTAIIPSIKDIDPLPEGITSDTDFCDYFYDSVNPKLTSDILNCLFTEKEQKTPIHSGMYGRPAVGASMIKAKFLITGRDTEVSRDSFANLINILNDNNKHTVAICGSAMGGTGAGGVPSLAQHLDWKLSDSGNRANVKLYIFYFLKHFTLTLPSEESNGPAVINEQIRRNAESGMCYWKDEIARGVDGCLLVGLDHAPQRNYQEVGAQSEQCQFLHLLAAVQLQKIFLGEEIFPGNLCGYAIPEGGLPINNLNVKLPNNNQVGLGDILKINEAVAEFLLLLKKLIDPLPGFSFVPSLPGKLDKILDKMGKKFKKSKKDICRDVSVSLQLTVKKIKEIYDWFVGDNGLLFKAKNDRFLTINESDIIFTTTKYKRLKKCPMDFIRKWCDSIKNIESLKEDYTKKLCNELKDALYRCLDEEFFRTFF